MDPKSNSFRTSAFFPCSDLADDPTSRPGTKAMLPCCEKAALLMTQGLRPHDPGQKPGAAKRALIKIKRKCQEKGPL